MGAPLGFKTFATGDVLTAADTNGYLMQGVWTFASAAARDAAVTSPQEGNVCYLKDTDAVMTYSGSAWVAVGGAAGGMTLLSTTTLTGASTTISSISQSYKSLVAFIYGMTNATADGIFRIAINGSTTGQAGVQIQNINNTPSGPSTIGGNTYLNTVTGLARTNSENSFQLTISNYTNIGTFKPYLLNGYMRATTPGDMYLLQSGAYQDVTVAITSLVFSNAGGNFSTGTVKLYGVN
jgi:hypothetical protein